MRIVKWFLKACPQNFIIKPPFPGTLILALFVFSFLVLYRPLGTHAGRFMGYEATMATYSVLASALLLVFLVFWKRLDYFSDKKQWTIIKELITIVVSLFVFGTEAYFIAFFMEEPAVRWTFATFFNSLKNAFLVGLIPFLFFTAMNLRYWFLPEQVWQRESLSGDELFAESREEPIRIKSRLKKETLEFYPSQFIYAESEGNYVNFFLRKKDKVEKRVIRNSINNIEQQLYKVPFFLRTHRAFIVNLEKVMVKKGNTLGYRLKLFGVEAEIPVSRNNTKVFNERFLEYQNEESH